MEKFVVHIFVCPKGGAPMQSVDSVLAIAGKGLYGDRYATGDGAFSRARMGTIRHVSLISLEAIEEANTNSSFIFFPKNTRRNIVTLGADLNRLVGKEFVIGSVRLRGVELCDPCDRPSALSKKPGFKEAFLGKGGLRAEIVEEGIITVGDPIRVMG